MMNEPLGMPDESSRVQEPHAAGTEELPRDAAVGPAPDLRPTAPLSEMARPSTPSFIDPAWREKAGAFFSSSSMRLRTAASKASVTVAEAAGGASTRMKGTWQVMQPRMAEAANKAGQSVKGTWETTKESWTTQVAPRMEAGISSAAKAAADTGLKLRQGLVDTTEKIKASEVGQRLSKMTVAGVERSQGLLAKNEWRTKTMRAEAALDGKSVFGVPLEVVAARAGPTAVPVPLIVVQCCDYLLEHGLHTAYIFETEGDPAVVKRIMKGFDEEEDMRIPGGTGALDVAQLLLVYLKCLPEPILTYRLYSDFVAFGGTDVQHLCRLLRTLPAPNLETLHRVLALLSRVATLCDENKMDAQSLAAEFAPVLLWREGAPGSISASASQDSKPPELTAGSGARPGEAAEDDVILSPVAGADAAGAPRDAEPAKVIMDVDGNVAAAAEIPFENDQPTHDQTALVEAVMVLIEQHDSIFSQSPDGPVLLMSEIQM